MPERHGNSTTGGKSQSYGGTTTKSLTQGDANVLYIWGELQFVNLNMREFDIETFDCNNEIHSRRARENMARHKQKASNRSSRLLN